MTELEIVNKALGKIGGGGDQIDGNAFITDLDASDRVSSWCKAVLPQVRQQIIAEFAAMECPFRETAKYTDLGTDLVSLDKTISNIVVGAGPSYTVTITTSESHGYTTGDKIRLYGIYGENDIQSLNNSVYTITRTSTTQFTLNTVTGDADWVYVADTGCATTTPAVRQYSHVFNLPSDYFAIVAQLNEVYTTPAAMSQKYRYEVLLNIDGDGWIFATNDLTNSDGDSAFILYAIDQTNETLMSPALIECIATLLAAELCPIIGKDIKTRQQMLAEYKQVAIPFAKRFNQSQFNSYSQTIPNYLGGRT